ALKLGQGPGGAGAVDPVGPPGVVAHLQQPLLQGAYVLAHQWVRDRVEQGTRPQPPPRRGQRLPRLLGDPAIRGEATGLLEGAHRAYHFGVELGWRLGRGLGQQPDLDQHLADLGYRRTRITLSDRAHWRRPGRYSASLMIRTNSLLGLAPTTCLTGSPSLKRVRVGSDMIR